MASWRRRDPRLYGSPPVATDCVSEMHQNAAFWAGLPWENKGQRKATSSCYALGGRQSPLGAGLSVLDGRRQSEVLRTSSPLRVPTR
jgi:hypothetical protein